MTARRLIGLTLVTVTAVAAGSGAIGTAAGSAPRANGQVAAGPGSRTTPLGAGTVFVLIPGTEGHGSISEFGPSAHGDARPIGTISGSHTGLISPTDLVLTSAGGIVVADPDGNAIHEFAPGARGNATPVDIKGAKTGLDGPVAVAIARNGAIWTVTGSEGMDPTTSLLEFAPGAHGNVAPIRAISGPKTLLAPASGIALTPDGRHIWVNHFGETLSGPNRAAVQEYATSASGDVAPVRAIAGAATDLQFPLGIFVDSSGNVTVDDEDYLGENTSALVTFGPAAHGNVKPLRLLAGAKTGLDQSAGLALSAAGDIWVANQGTDAIERFAPRARGDVGPTRRLAGSLSGISDPVAVAVYERLPTAPRGLRAHARSHRRVTLRWRAPVGTGGGLLGYRVFRKASGHGRWKLAATTTRRTTTVHGQHRGTTYRFRVSAYNERGESKPGKPATARVS